MLEYKKAWEQSCAIYRLTGRLGMDESARKIGEDIRQLKDHENVRVLLDLRDVSMIDSSGIGLLIVYKKMIEEMHGALAVCLREGSMPHKVFSSAALERALHVFLDRSKAVDFLRSCHAGDDETKQALMRLAAAREYADERPMLDQVASRCHTLTESLTLLEDLAVSILSQKAAAMHRNARIARLGAMACKLEERYKRTDAAPPGGAAIVGDSMDSPAASMLDAYLAHRRWRTHRISPANDIGEIVDVFKAEGCAAIFLCPTSLEQAKSMAEQAAAKAVDFGPSKIAFYWPGNGGESLAAALKPFALFSRIQDLEQHFPFPVDGLPQT